KTIFVVLQDCSGEVQCVAAPEAIKEHHLKLEDTVEIVGRVRAEPRAKLGYELDIAQVRVLNRSGQQLPFTCSSNLDSVSPETYSLDLELGFIDGPEDVIQLERELLTYILESVNKEFDDVLRSYREQPLPSMLGVPCWEFARCLELLKEKFDRSDLSDDLDPEAERQPCRLAERETSVPAVFVLGFPLSGRPFYTAPRGSAGAANSFDLLFHGVEITTGGQ